MSDPVFSGRVSTVVYQSDDYRVLKVLLDSDSPSFTPVSVTGYFPSQNVQVGSWISFAAKWETHPRYGRQLKVTRSPVAVPSWTEERVMSALGANGVGPQLRLKLKLYAQDHGVEIVTLLDSGTLEGGGWDEMTAMFILNRWRTLRTHLEGARFLSEAGVPPKAIGKLRRVLGDELESAVTSDPWILVRIAGVSFKEADEVALRLGVSLDKPERVRGAVLTAVRDVAREGHLYAYTGQVMHSVQRMIPGNVDARKVADAIKSLVTQKQLKANRHPEDNSVVLYISWNHEMETACAEILKHRGSEAESTVTPERANDELEKWAQARDVTLTETQRLAAFRVLTEPISVLTGLPGTGKTTTLQGAVSVLKDCEVPFLLVAPTGIAAKRLSSVTGAPASTVHRAFSAKGWKDDGDGERTATYVGIVGSDQSKSGDDTKAQTWGYGPDNPHPAQVVIVDESSMLDLHMLYRLLTGTQESCRMVFVGDPFQLPSVGAGDVLRDIASSGVFAHTHLSEIFRQDGTSGIVLAAHDIHAGQTPDMDLPDFTLLDADDEQHASSIIMSEVRRLYAQRKNFQVLSPRHGGDAGVTNLNEILRVTINPPTPGVVERSLAGSVVRESDRIMVIKNDYDKGVYNGDVGTVSRIDIRNKKLVIRVFASNPNMPQQEVTYDLTKGSPPIRLAYAQTVHKSQGQEYDVIVVPVLSSFGRQLQRNLLYTAITRAKKRVVLVGKVDAVHKAIRNNRANKRNTLLSHRLGGPARPTFGY